jgi:hypothetical protein
MASTVFPASSAGGTSNLTQAQVAATVPSYTLQHTITSSTNNFATNGATWVYAVVVGGGGVGSRGIGGSSGQVTFGMTPTRSVVRIGASTGPTAFGNIQSGGGTVAGSIYAGSAGYFDSREFPSVSTYSRAGESGLIGGGGNNQSAGGNSTAGFNGGASGTNAPGASGGGGGGAGLLASGSNGGNGNQNNGNTSTGGAGGAGGGGGGAGGSNNNFCGTNYASGGAGGAGVVLVYY